MALLYVKDYRILAELEKNSRQSFSQIAKNLKMSKEVVNYHVKKLQKEGIITRFFAEINLHKLGLQVYKVYFQFQNVNDTKEKEMYTYFAEKLRIPWIVSCSGKYDLIISFGAGDINHFNEYLTKIMNKFSQYILHKEISTTLCFSTYDRKWLHPSLKIRKTTVGGPLEKNDLDKKEIALLSQLSDNSRTPLIDLAKKVSLTSSGVMHRIKTLKMKGIINGYRMGIGYKKLGKEFCKAFVYLTQKTTKEENRFLTYVQELPEIFTVIKCVGSWDIELEFIVDDFTSFHTIMKDLKNHFEIIRGYESVIISKEYGINYFNFI